MKQLTIGGKAFDLEPEYIIVKLDNEGCKLIFQHLFDKGLRGEYKIVLEKINE